MGKNNDLREVLQALGLITQLGLLMIANIGVGFGLGYLLDTNLATGNAFKIGGLILGTASGFYSNFRLIMDFIGDDNNDTRKS
ncbi:AtpZ/AtpI family protein [Halothermothrix orenii]|uniref:F0F1-ATPase subunit n=1 Tax=Halothermothrix orenii (strain H 168 / OCM 544 / DSM 9562) TaxID=373903 RepID=B8CZ19_HALOH|nr:AtpZ/AtpI family protein [Halothermothrix orenii]ACL70538.1 hypothetical protein Hore_17890 [Halothermothrix orenii H 168]